MNIPVIELLAERLRKAGVILFSKMLAKRFAAQDIVAVTRCEQCKYASKYDTIQGLIYYCNAHEHVVPTNGFCYDGE